MNEDEQNGLTHVGPDGQPAMVNVGEKLPTRREAIARSEVIIPAEVEALFKDGELHSAKGPVFQTAIIAGTQAVKRTADLIPFCHPMPIEACNFAIELVGNRIVIDCRVGVYHKTGVEMEALTGASVAALTVYDMCKAVSQEMIIGETRVIRKTGGKHDIDRT